jgi:hypothetical protein
MSEEDGQDDGYGDKERIQAWLDGWGQYAWAVLAVMVVAFIIVNIVTGLQ